MITWHAHWPERPDTFSPTNPFSRDTYLSALEATGVCQADTGWQPHHLLWHEGEDTVRMPAYIKGHSWGEYVFDWAWANAYEQHGLRYYPKLLCAIPYTPSTGPRWLDNGNSVPAGALAEGLEEEAKRLDLSGVHLLFPDNATAQQWRTTDWVERTDVQFHWYNAGYRDFADFLDRFASRKRKNVRKERQSIADQGIDLRSFEGNTITPERLRQFYVFYHATYLKRGRKGYLNLGFFEQLLARQPQTLVLFLAYQGQNAVAGALCLRDDTSLYGRYWGSVEHYNNLHFETCYYQGIDYCIRHGLQRFDPGTQGEHKVARGFEPTFTHSFHWLAQPDFQQAIRRYCQEEAEMVRQYHQQVTGALPFRVTEK
ncbi:MAG: GNAT family N-acetyltransferase [Saccharospirillum sp.]